MRDSSNSRNPLRRPDQNSKYDGYSYYITEEEVEYNFELSGKNSDTFKFSRPTFGDCLVNKNTNPHSTSKNSKKSTSKIEAVSWSAEQPGSGKHNIDDLLEELASESGSESESGSDRETIEQYYARIKKGIKTDAAELGKRRRENREQNLSRASESSVDMFDTEKPAKKTEKVSQEEMETASNPPISPKKPVDSGLSTADEIRASTADEILSEMKDVNETDPNQPQPDPNKTQKQNEDDLEYWKLYKDSQFGLADNLYDEDLDDADESFAKENKLTKAENSDAILTCGRCFTILCYDCQRHIRYEHQFRAMFVTENCRIVPDRIVKFRKKEVGKGGKRRRVEKKKGKKRTNAEKKEAEKAIQSSSKITSPTNSAPAAEMSCSESEAESVAETPNIPKPSGSKPKLNEFSSKKKVEETEPGDFDDPELYDHYFQVECAECQNDVAYFDKEEVYHFYNVIAS